MRTDDTITEKFPRLVRLAILVVFVASTNLAAYWLYKILTSTFSG